VRQVARGQCWASDKYGNVDIVVTTMTSRQCWQTTGYLRHHLEWLEGIWNNIFDLDLQLKMFVECLSFVSHTTANTWNLVALRLHAKNSCTIYSY